MIYFVLSSLIRNIETIVSKLLSLGFSQINLENLSLICNIETIVSKLLSFGNKNKS